MSEKNNIDDGGPAFNNISVRDYFAARAMQGFCANPAVFSPNAACGWSLANRSEEDLVAFCYRLAGRAVEARKK